MTRSSVAQAKRIVVKVGSSSLTTREGALDVERVDALVRAIAETAANAEVVLVSSGAIAAGLAPLGLTKRPTDLPSQQAAASVGQGRLMAHYNLAFSQFDKTVGQVLLTVDDITRRTHYNNAQRTLTRLLELGVVPIVNENDTVATSEIRFGDNDRLAALVALLIQADALLLLSDVDGLYDGPPSAGATLISEVSDFSIMQDIEIGGTGSAVGSGGMATKVEAAHIASAAGIHVVLTSASNAAAALKGDLVGTYFHPTGTRRPARILWLEHATATRGQLHLDAGAVSALVERGSSLLPAGVRMVQGEFVEGDAVELVGPDSVVIARGLVNFDAVDVPKLLGKSTKEIVAEFGETYDKELIHRDDLVILHRGAH
jgi:glutamate 5-kinase